MMKLPIILISLLLFTACGHSNKNESSSENFRTDTTVKFLWRAEQYDEALKDTFNTIFINEEYCKTITDPERAALGYVATFVGSECDWDGEEKDDRRNLKCKVLSALNLGYQCSDQHLNFLRTWFKNDTTVMSDLEECPVIPYTASSQQTFDDISLTVKSDTIKVLFGVDGINMTTGDSWHYIEEDIFKVEKNSIRLLVVNHSDVKTAKVQ